MLFALLSLFSLLDLAEDFIERSEKGQEMPLRGLFQSLKLLASIFALIFTVSLLIGKSPGGRRSRPGAP
ncbi:MAG: hypothetical protein U5J62_03480 [Desulfurivibrio sp.]|nr:hypothetical protein [Desulfurivibrio sp.]